MRSPGRYYVPSLRFEANTGPKGVIADAQAFEHAKRSRRFSFARKHKTTSSTPISVPRTFREKDEYEEKSSADSEDEGFMARWRQGRLREMQTKAVGQRRASPSKRIYGSLVTVDAEGYLDAIEKVHRDTVVVVYIYDDMVSRYLFSPCLLGYELIESSRLVRRQPNDRRLCPRSRATIPNYPLRQAPL
jgi:Phosducin